MLAENKSDVSRNSAFAQSKQTRINFHGMDYSGSRYTECVLSSKMWNKNKSRHMYSETVLC